MKQIFQHTIEYSNKASGLLRIYTTHPAFKDIKIIFKKTWATISDIMNKQINKSEYPDFFK